MVMLAYRIVRELAERWRDFDLTVEDGIKQLTTLCATEVLIEGRPRCNKIPEPRSAVRRLLKAARVRLPDALPCSGVRAATRKKLTDQRKSRWLVKGHMRNNPWLTLEHPLQAPKS